MFVGLLPVQEDLKRIRAVREAIGGSHLDTFITSLSLFVFRT